MQWATAWATKNSRAGASLGSCCAAMCHRLRERSWLQLLSQFVFVGCVVPCCELIRMTSGKLGHSCICSGDGSPADLRPIASPPAVCGGGFDTATETWYQYSSSRRFTRARCTFGQLTRSSAAHSCPRHLDVVVLPSKVLYIGGREVLHVQGRPQVQFETCSPAPLGATAVPANPSPPLLPRARLSGQPPARQPARRPLPPPVPRHRTPCLRSSKRHLRQTSGQAAITAAYAGSAATSVAPQCRVSFRGQSTNPAGLERLQGWRRCVSD